MVYNSPKFFDPCIISKCFYYNTECLGLYTGLPSVKNP